MLQYVHVVSGHTMYMYMYRRTFWHKLAWFHFLTQKQIFVKTVNYYYNSLGVFTKKWRFGIEIQNTHILPLVKTKLVHCICSLHSFLKIAVWLKPHLNKSSLEISQTNQKLKGLNKQAKTLIFPVWFQDIHVQYMYSNIKRFDSISYMYLETQCLT